MSSGGLNIPSTRKNDFIVTPSQNKICRSAVLHGSQHIQLAGQSVLHGAVLIRGDVANIRIGRLVVVGQAAAIKPPHKKSKKDKGLVYIPVTVGDNVVIGANADISAAAIGSNVEIGDGVIIGERCILSDNCKIRPGSVLAPDTNVPPFAVFSGVPALYDGELHESWPLVMRFKAEKLYTEAGVGNSSATATTNSEDAK